MPVVTNVSQATRPIGSSAMIASSTESEIWSAILSGCPSVTDSDVKRNSFDESLLMEFMAPLRRPPLFATTRCFA